jgi:hypothetical protein
MEVKIYLRSIVNGGKHRLAMFDSNRNGDIDELITVAEPGAKIIWKLDCLSGIKSIKTIYSKTIDGEHQIFKTNPKKLLLSRGFSLQLLEGAIGEEAYAIDYILCDDSKWTTDPVIRVPPPPTKT